MGRSPCCSKEGLNKGAWTADEDKILKDFIKIHGEGRWRNLPKRAGLMRCGKSCRLRWLNYLKPDIKRGNISPDEEELIIRLHKLLGNRWSLIAGRLPGRTDNEIKNYWNTNLCKKVEKNKSKSNVMEPQPNGESSHVVRTRAVKCSKGFITPQPNEKADPTANDTLVVAKPVDKLIPAEEDNPRDFGLDVDMGDVWLSEFLDSEWMGYCRSNSSIELSGDMLEDWSGNGFLQGNSNHNGLASFLEYGSDWLPN